MIQGTIETIAFGGQGILRHDGLVIFVPFTAPGDRVTVRIVQKKKQHARGELITIDQPSKLRTSPLCSYFGRCGGCQLQHITYTAQLESKRRFVQDALERIGKLTISVPPISPAENIWNYRRHIRLTIRGHSVGYIGADHHTFIPVEYCPIFTKPHEEILGQLHQFLNEFDSSDPQEISVRIFKQESGQYLLVFTFESSIPDHLLKAAEQTLKSNAAWTGIILHANRTTHSFGNTECLAEILGLSMAFSPFGFIQNHPEQSEKLYRMILESIPFESRKVLDLFCGIGTTSLLLAKRGAEVIGVESHKETVDLAKENALRNKLENVKFFCGKAEKITKEIIGSMQPDCVLCNPPRTGLEPSLVQAILDTRPQHLVYVSCMPATLARDLRLFTEAGYTIDSVQAFDMFPQTTHVETLVKLSLLLRQN